MAISDAAYQAWLYADRPRCVLVEATAYSGGETTRYVSNRAFTSRPSDTPANTPYDEILISESVRFTQRLNELFTGRTLPTWGDLELVNAGGALDGWFADAWDGRRLVLLLGDPSWPRTDFRPILDGVTADIGASRRDRVTLKIRDKSWMLNVPAQAALVGGSTANKDQPIPLGYGPVFNAEPILVDASTHKYQLHDGAIDAITDVRENGASTGYTPDLATGTFTLGGAPSGRITADFRGAKPGGVYLTKCADIIQHLVTTHSQLTTADIDAASFSAFNSTCPQALQLYVRERRNLMDVLDDLVVSVGGWWTFSRAGLLQLGRLAAPTGSAVLSLTADDIQRTRLEIVRRELPVTTLRLGYARNWTPQADGVAGSVTEANRALYAAEHQVALAENASLPTTHKLAQRPDVRSTLIAGASDAGTEATRLQALRDVIRTTYRAHGYMAPATLNLGQEVRLTHPRFGFSSGANAIAVGFEERPVANRIVVDLWR